MNSLLSPRRCVALPRFLFPCVELVRRVAFLPLLSPALSPSWASSDSVLSLPALRWPSRHLADSEPLLGGLLLLSWDTLCLVVPVSSLLVRVGPSTGSAMRLLLRLRSPLLGLSESSSGDSLSGTLICVLFIFARGAQGSCPLLPGGVLPEALVFEPEMLLGTPSVRFHTATASSHVCLAVRAAPVVKSVLLPCGCHLPPPCFMPDSAPLALLPWGLVLARSPLPGCSLSAGVGLPARVPLVS